MTATVLEELPLIRSKNAPLVDITGTGPTVGPGSYDTSVKNKHNNSLAPFNTTSVRPPLSLIDPRIPGPGAYVIPSPTVSRGVASCPFASEASRFPLSTGEGVPGPGSYNCTDRWPTKRAPTVHQFRAYDEPVLVGDAPGPGYYSPGVSQKPCGRTAHFGKYSGRDAPRANTNPGPGTYDSIHNGRSLYSLKPQSMFATKTKRSQLPCGDVPGPGTYEATSLFTRQPKTERFSAFSTTASRFSSDNSVTPGPGAYTGELAPRRQHRFNGNETHPFASESNRFYNESSGSPGPGAYDGSKFPKRMAFGGETPFGSTVPRFGRNSRLWASEGVYHDQRPLRFPRRVKPQRTFIERDLEPSTVAQPLPDRSYDVRYDWPKPTSFRSTFGSGPRFAASESQSAAPGPGSYDSSGGFSRTGRQFGNSNWGRETRFCDTSQKGNPGPGSYYHETTFLKKTFNQTIGSDAVYQ